ncbi:hypothetical protein RRF57_001196 [Xylaria bambusicola]|uniref:lytic cellulose monooxygenase (C4-dehydrogenating) n=1 Tax=Xylaria bambusicola TaxID=326684 RepID=A0AAN7U552_9PEZI
MENFVNLAALLALAANSVSAHYIFQQFTAGSTKFDTFQYNYGHFINVISDLASNDLRCNVGATGAGTETIEMQAGESFSFTLDTAVYHQGPISIYMSKAPSVAADYDGSGEWFKIKDFETYSYTIPKCIENGEYLLRIQSLAIHNPWPAGIPQFVKVTGGSGTANPTNALIPGAFKESDPGYTANIYNNFKSYQVPGPAPLTC